MPENAADLSRAIEAVRADPRFPQACRRYSEGMSAFYGADPLRPKLLADLGRFAVVAAMMASPAPVTVSNLARLSGGLTGRARIGRHFDVLEKSGMAARAPLPDRRIRALRPTAALEALMGGWMHAMAAPAMALAGRADVRLEDPVVVRRYLAQVMGCRAIGFNAFADVPAVERLMTLSGGHLLVLRLQAAPAGLDEPIPFSRTAFARAHGLSRPHVVDLLREAEASGWLRREPEGLRVAAGFLAEIQRWLAIHFALAPLALDGRLLAVLTRREPWLL